MNTNLRWAIIGMGRFGQVHARAIDAAPGCQLTAICNRNPNRLHTAATQLGIDRATTDYRQLLSDPEIDVVSITTHWKDHFEVAKAALESGKHVLLEKPMAASGWQCRQLLEVASRAAGFLMVGHVCRFDPRVTLAKEAIAARRIGRIVSLHAKRNLPLAPGSIRLDKISPLMGDGIHDADLIMWFLDRSPSRLYGRYIQFGSCTYPEVGWAMLEFDDQAIGVVETNWGLPPNVPTVIDAKIEVVGTAGMLTVDCAHMGLSILDSNGPRQVDTVYWPEQHGQLIGALRAELEYFAGCIRQGRAPQVITAAEAARAVMAMEAAERSAREGRLVEMEGLDS